MEDESTDNEDQLVDVVGGCGDAMAEREVQCTFSPDLSPISATDSDEASTIEETRHLTPGQSSENSTEEAQAAPTVNVHASQQPLRGNESRRRNGFIRRPESPPEIDRYQAEAEAVINGDTPARNFQRPQHSATVLRLRARLQGRCPAGQANDTGAHSGRPTVCVVDCDEVPPILQHDSTLYFTADAKRDFRYGLAAAKTLAQMALRDGEDGGTVVQPEPELVAWNLRELGASDLISHRQHTSTEQAHTEQVPVDATSRTDDPQTQEDASIQRLRKPVYSTAAQLESERRRRRLKKTDKLCL